MSCKIRVFLGFICRRVLQIRIMSCKIRVFLDFICRIGDFAVRWCIVNMLTKQPNYAVKCSILLADQVLWDA